MPEVQRQRASLPPFETLRFAAFLRVRWSLRHSAETFTNSGRAGLAGSAALQSRSGVSQAEEERLWRAALPRMVRVHGMIDAKSLDLILRNGRTHNVFLDKPVSDDAAPADPRDHEMGPDLAELAARAGRLRAHQGGQGEAAAGAQPRQPGQDHGGAGDGDHRLRFALLRAPAADLPAQSGGAEQLHRRGQGGARAQDRLPQRHPAGRLSASSPRARSASMPAP